MEPTTNEFAAAFASDVATESVHVRTGIVCASRGEDVNRARYSS